MSLVHHSDGTYLLPFRHLIRHILSTHSINILYQPTTHSTHYSSTHVHCMHRSEVKDLIDDELLSEADVNEMVKDVIGTKKNLNFEDFYSLVGQLDDMVEGEDGDYDDDEEEDYDDEEDDDEENEDDDGADGEMQLFAQELYDSLCGKEKNLAVAKFKKWPEVQELINDKIITEADLNKLVKESGSDGKTLTFEQFYDVLSVLETEEDEDESFEVLNSDKGFNTKTSQTTSTKKQSAVKEMEEDEEEDDGFDDLSNEEVDELLTEFYDELKGTGKKVTIASFMEWEEVQEMLNSGAVDKKTIDGCLKEAGVGKDMTYEQVGMILIQYRIHLICNP